MYDRNSTTIVWVFLFLTYIFKLLIWGLFYLIVRFIVKLFIYYWMLDTRQGPTKSFSSVRLSVHLSILPFVRLSLTFLKIGSLDFPDIVHDDSWPWYLVIYEARLLKKNGGPTEFGSNGHKSGQDEVFCYFLEFVSYVFLEIAYNDSPWQCLTSSGSKTDEKSLEAQTWATQAKIGAEISFLGHFLRFGLLVFFDIAQDCSLERCLMSSRAKTSTTMTTKLWPK